MDMDSQQGKYLMHIKCIFNASAGAYLMDYLNNPLNN